ncbi:hypothetical protein ADE_11260 [Achromobacter denitrificans]|nr:retention module-containing protein [Achromobacter denitrificans]GFN25428.1 hypothetical protein ADE_11260 [Achromobacter denitrificans]
MANTSPAVVNEISGRAWIRNSDGSLTELHQGSKVPAGADVVTASGATVSLQVGDGMPLVIGEGREVAMNADVGGPLADPSEAAVAPPSGTDSDRLLAALRDGRDPFDDLDPTAAVVAGGGDAGGSSFVRLARILETTSPLDLAYPNPARGEDILPRMSATGAGEDDGDGTLAPTVTVNNPPSALDDAGRGDQNSLVRGNLLLNDSDPDGDPLTITSISGRAMTPGRHHGHRQQRRLLHRPAGRQLRFQPGRQLRPPGARRDHHHHHLVHHHRPERRHVHGDRGRDDHRHQ